MRTRNSVTLLLCGTLALSAEASAQAVVPIRELSAPEAKTTQHFGNIFGVRPLKNGGVLVNDGMRRQLVALDATFGTRTVVIDSVAEGGQSYGPRAAPLIAYLGDSSLFVDGQSTTLVVIDPSGKISTVRSAPVPSDINALAGTSSGVDAQGNLVYRAPFRMTRTGPPPGAAPGQPPAPIGPPDSSAIVRASFETRSVDTVGRVKTATGNRTNMTQGADGKMNMVMTINPLPTVDDWSVMSDGTIAFVRGHDYHIDFIRPDGKAFSTPKLPFDWKRLTDEDKQALIDSARTAQEKAAADAKVAGANPGAAGARAGVEMGARMEMTVVMASGAAGGGSMGGGGGGGAPVVMSTGPGGPPGAIQITPKYEFVPLKDIADYYPAIRPGATKADLDGNLWILTTTSAQSKAGELIYDVVNNKGELFQRVRMPVGRSIAGFGHKGIVYLMYRDGTNGWLLERTKILNNTRAAEN